MADGAENVDSLLSCRRLLGPSADRRVLGGVAGHCRGDGCQVVQESLKLRY